MEVGDLTDATSNIQCTLNGCGVLFITAPQFSRGKPRQRNKLQYQTQLAKSLTEVQEDNICQLPPPEIKKAAHIQYEMEICLYVHSGYSCRLFAQTSTVQDIYREQRQSLQPSGSHTQQLMELSSSSARQHRCCASPFHTSQSRCSSVKDDPVT